MQWQIAAVANGVIMVAYFAISFTIFNALRREGQLRTNKLGLATAMIFFSCGAGHGEHLLHLGLPALIDYPEGLSARGAYDWHLMLVDVVTACVGVYYWSIRSTYRAVLHGPKLFEDQRERQRQALELNDRVVQGLTAAQYAIEVGDSERAQASLTATLASARGIISDLLDDATAKDFRPGDLVRNQAAAIQPDASAG